MLAPLEELELYLNFGSGFHSNDARSAIESGGSGALPRALGYELGARTRLLGGRLDLAAAVWRLDLASELVWSGDRGGTEPSGSTRREGIDLEAPTIRSIGPSRPVRAFRLARRTSTTRPAIHSRCSWRRP